jgi:hypothetical protein
VRGGVPAVVGMQLAISDRAALTFSRVLYARLAAGEPIEAAVGEARLALYLADSGSRDWVAPVLFLRGSDARSEEEIMKGKSAERDVKRTVFNGDEFEGGEIDVTGEIFAERPQGARPCDSHTEANIKQVKAKKLTITGSDQRGAK